jgi:outer membrane lipoprotein LolB
MPPGIAGVALALLSFVLTLALTACTSAPAVRGDAGVDTSDQAFSIGGRLSAKRGTNGATANFDWDHAATRDRIDLASPLGQVYARIDGAGDHVDVLRPGGTTESYPDWRSMTTSLLGAPVPMDDLAFWIRGAARDGVPASVERDAQGRALVLRQQAWEIVYAYPDDAKSARPSRVVMTYPDTEPVEVRIAVDRWDAPRAIR